MPPAMPALRRCPPHRPSPGPAPTAPPSPTRCSRLPASLYVAIEQIQNRRLGRCHREVPPASPSSHPPRAAARIAPTVRRHPRHPPSLSSRCGGPGPWLARIAPHASPFSRMREKGPPSWQHPPEMHAFRDQDGNILAPCIHSRVQSGDSGYMARESCRQGPFFASRNPKSRMARRCCQRRPAFPRQRHAVRPNGLCALLSRFAVRDPPRGPRTDASRYLRAAPIPPAARTHRVQETSGTTQATQCEHKNRIPKWGPY